MLWPAGPIFTLRAARLGWRITQGARMSSAPTATSPTSPAASSPVLQTQPLGPLWPTMDPFLFCAHHDDAYPAGDGAFAPAVSLEGRQIGSDFSRKDGWSTMGCFTNARTSMPDEPGVAYAGSGWCDRLIILTLRASMLFCRD